MTTNGPPRGEPPGADRLPASPPPTVLRELDLLLLGGESVQSVLQKVAGLAAGLPGVSEASVTLVQRSGTGTVASTGLMAYELDERQYQSGDGPCLQAARDGEPVLVDDVRSDTRWPAYAETAARKGTLGSLSVPVPLTVAASEGPVCAALNLYSAAPGAFGDPATLEAAQHVAAHAAVAISNMIGLQTARDSAEGLLVAMQSRAVIEQAKGVLMGRLHITADQAFTQLSQQSQRANRKLRELAQEIVDAAGG